MSLELYFLRSSEQYIVSDMLFYSQRVDTTNKQTSDFEQLKIYEDFYGLTRKDLGLYAMQNNKVCGAIWTRRLNEDHHCNAFIDQDTPVLNIAVKPEFRNQGIARSMMQQFFLEAGALYSAISVSVLNTQEKKAFFKKFGFETVDTNKQKSYVDGSECVIMKKNLEQKAIQRPSDGYDPRRWMD